MPEKIDLVKLLEGEKTESEKYIAELRNFKNQHPQEYNRIKISIIFQVLFRSTI